MKVRTLLLLFFLACETPLLLACALITYDAYGARRELNETHMLDTARVLRAAVEERLTVARSSLLALATSPAFAQRDLRAIYDQAVALSRLSNGVDVILADRDGMQLINSYRAFDAPPVRRGNLDVVREVFTGGEPVVSGLFRGAITHRPLVSVDVPVFRDGAVAYDLSLTLPADAIQALLRDNPLPSGWYAAVLDQHGVVVARTVRPEDFVGTPASEETRARIAAMPEGRLERDNLEGARALIVFTRGEIFGWSVALGVPKRILIAETVRSLYWVLFGVGAFTLIALIGALLLGHRMAAAIGRLVDPALALGREEPVVVGRHRVREVDLVAGALRNAAATLRQARDALRQSEARFREFAESASDWLWELDPAGRVTYVSERFEAITGMPASHIMGKTRDEYLAAHPDSDLDEIDAAYQARQSYAFKRLVMITSDGRVLTFRVSGRPRFSPSGEFLGYRGTASDVTAQTMAEERRQQAEKLTALGRLAGGIAHDFNNVLGAIAGFAQFLREDLPAGSAQNRFAERIALAAERARALIRQILSFARSTPEERRPLSVATVVRDMLPLLQAALPSTTRIGLSVEAEDAWVLGNETELSQLLLNLCVNASDALESRYGTVRLSVGRPSVAPPAGGDGWYTVTTADPAAVADPVCLTVEDDGPGMDDTVLRQVFEPFFTTKSDGRGTGLGLAVVHGIVTSMNGAIEISSRPERGTRVRVFLPTTPPATAADAKRQAGAPRGSELVLLAEDDADVAAMTHSMLTRLGYRVESFIDGAAALAAFAAAPARWDVVVTDFAMPGISGVELIHAIKQVRPALPCILVTGYMENVTEQIARTEGADALLHKPVDQLAFAEVLQRVLAATRAPAAGV